MLKPGQFLYATASVILLVIACHCDANPITMRSKRQLFREYIPHDRPLSGNTYYLHAGFPHPGRWNDGRPQTIPPNPNHPENPPPIIPEDAAEHPLNGGHVHPTLGQGQAHGHGNHHEHEHAHGHENHHEHGHDHGQEFSFEGIHTVDPFQKFLKGEFPDSFHMFEDHTNHLGSGSVRTFSWRRHF